MNTKNAILAFALCFGMGAVGASAQAPGSKSDKPAVVPKPPIAAAPLPENKQKKVAQAPKAAVAAAPLPGAADKPMAMDAKCKMMQGDMGKMEKEMQQGHEKLEKLVGAMNAAPAGPERVDSLVAVVNEMVAQSNAMHQMHSGMMQKMMQHMSEHMMGGSGPKAHEGMMNCPMMQDHGGEHGKVGAESEHTEHAPGAPKDGAAEDHSAHHPPAK